MPLQSSFMPDPELHPGKGKSKAKPYPLKVTYAPEYGGKGGLKPWHGRIMSWTQRYSSKKGREQAMAIFNARKYYKAEIV